MQNYLTPKDVAERLQISVDAARNEMRKMRHKLLGKNGQILRVSEADFDAYMRPDPPLPNSAGKRRKPNPKVTHPERAIPYRTRGGEEPCLKPSGSTTAVNAG